MMTDGQRGNFKMLRSNYEYSTSECHPLASMIALAVPTATASAAQASGGLQRRIDKAQVNSKDFPRGKVLGISRILRQGVLKCEVTHCVNDCPTGFTVGGLAIDSVDLFITSNGSSVQFTPLVPRAGSPSTSWTYGGPDHSIYNS